ncbi:hypothetical protein, partial [Salmonella enterica]
LSVSLSDSDNHKFALLYEAVANLIFPPCQRDIAHWRQYNKSISSNTYPEFGYPTCVQSCRISRI